VETATASNVVEITKRCTKCGVDKASSLFKRDYRRKDNLFRPTCKECDKEALRVWRAANPNKTRAADLRTKANMRARAHKQAQQDTFPVERKCSVCGVIRALSEYSKNSTAPFQKSPRCKVCERNQGAIWRQGNKPKIREKHAKVMASYDPVQTAQRRKEHPTGLQKCSYCKLEKPFSAFCLSRVRKIGLSIVCRPCTTEKSKAWRAENLDKVLEGARRSHRLRKYGLSQDAYDALFAAQGNKCAVCRDILQRGTFRAHIDHDHDTGAVRGLLCNTCNSGIGMFRERADLLLAAAAYLKRSRGET
jgi:hypothetical protein